MYIYIYIFFYTTFFFINLVAINQLGPQIRFHCQVTSPSEVAAVFGRRRRRRRLWTTATSESGRGRAREEHRGQPTMTGTGRDGVCDRDSCCVMQLVQQTNLCLLLQPHDATQVPATYAIPACSRPSEVGRDALHGRAPSRLRRRPEGAPA